MADSPSTLCTGLTQMYPKASRCGIRRRSRRPRTKRCIVRNVLRLRDVFELCVRRPVRFGSVLILDVRLCRCVFSVRDILVLDLRKLTHRFGVAHDVQRVLELRVRMFVLCHQPTFRVAILFHRLLRAHSSGAPRPVGWRRTNGLSEVLPRRDIATVYNPLHVR